MKLKPASLSAIQYVGRGPRKRRDQTTVFFHHLGIRFVTSMATFAVVEDQSRKKARILTNACVGQSISS